jgi:hypothetical protein
MHLDIPSVAEAMAALEDGSAWYGPAVHPLLLEAVKTMIGYQVDYRESNNQGVLRAQFRDYYTGRRAEAIRDTQVGHKGIGQLAAPARTTRMIGDGLADA